MTRTGHTCPSWLPLWLPFLHTWESATAEGLGNSTLSMARGLEWALDQGRQPLHICDSGCSAFGGGSESFPEKPGPELDPRPNEGQEVGPILFLGHGEPQTQLEEREFYCNTRACIEPPSRNSQK